MEDLFDTEGLAGMYEDNELSHEGVGHLDGGHSGRYPWGSGDNSFQRPKDFYSYVKNRTNKGYKPEDIAKNLGLSMKEFEEAYKEAYIDNYRPKVINKAYINKSGNYPWGENKKFTTPMEFVNYIDDNKDKMTEAQLSEKLGMNTISYRAYKNIAKSITDRIRDTEIRRLNGRIDPDTGKPYTNEKIGAIVGNMIGKPPLGESTIRAITKNSGAESKQNAAVNSAILIMKRCDETGKYVEIGKGSGPSIGITNDKMKEAIKICEAEGYNVVSVRKSVPGQEDRAITYSYIYKGEPGKYKEAYDSSNCTSLIDYISEDNGQTFTQRYVYPKAMNKDRIMIRYNEEGGLQKDGLIEIREGVKDLTMGNKTYCQARILVDNGGGDNDLYMKGMAVYSDGHDMPEGIDIIFNTNKPKGTPKEKVLKSVAENLAKDKNNPFGATLKIGTGQTWYEDPNGTHTDPITGKKISLSLVNKKSEEGDWQSWSKNLPSQFLAKQPLRLIKKQINNSVSKKEAEYSEIMSLENYAVRSKLLDDFAEQCDRDAIDLQASSFDNTRYHVLLPSKTLKPNEIYAPGYPEGTQLALVRFPHGGTFEIPILTVNNSNKECIDMIGSTPADAVCIPATAASQLSGADFDGDTALCIPTGGKNGVLIQNSPRLIQDGWETGIYGPDVDGIKTDSDGNTHYFRNGIEYKHISEEDKQKNMGIVSNLITDMTIQGASRDELERAVKHSMVVIDSYKHHLDYKQSEEDNKIDELKEKYQKRADGKYGGAATLLSKAKSPQKIPELEKGGFVLNIEGHPDYGHRLKLLNPVKETYLDEKTGEIYNKKDKKTIEIDPKTGEKLYHETMKTYYKVELKDPETNKKYLSNVYIKNNGILPDVNKPYIKPEYNLKFYDLKKSDDLYYFDKKTKEPIAIKQDDKRLKALVDTKEYPLMSLVKDAHEISGVPIEYPQEVYYAEYANKLKSLANEARKGKIEADNNRTPYSETARLKYQEEYKSLDQKVKQAQLNAPKEKYALELARDKISKMEAESSVEWSVDQRNRYIQNALFEMREKVGAKSPKFNITDKEWEAIQAGAVAHNMLLNILRYADPDRVRQLATPRATKELNSVQIARIKGLAANGETTSSIARRLGISASTVSKYLDNGGK